MNNNYCNGIVHTVRKGDTLYSLSRQYNVPLVMILRANPYVDVYNLGIGMRLCIPVSHMDNSDMDTENNGMNNEMNNGMNNGMDNGMNNGEHSKTFAYVVREGESVQYIVDRFGIDLEDILKINSLSDMLLQPGITVILPMKE